MTTKANGEDLSPEDELRTFIERYDPKVQKLFRSVRTATRKRFPTANELAYEYSDSVVISYSPTERGIEGIVAISGRVDGVFFYLSGGPQLPDPKKLLQGSAKTTRFIPVEVASRLAHPDVEALIVAAIKHAKVPMPAEGKGKLIIQSSAAKRRPRGKTTK